MTPRLVAEAARLAGQPLLRCQTDRRLVDLVRVGNERAFEAIVERGGKQRLGGVLVFRSSTLDGDVGRRDGITITTAARTLVDLAPHLGAPATGRAFREALRLRTTTTQRLLSTLERHRSRPGCRLLRELATRYAGIPYQRTRSDAESRALELLHDAGVEPPQSNIRIAGQEADLAWPQRDLIVEIDGPQYHQFPDQDAHNRRRWEAAGYTVRRIGSGVVYDEPAKLIALVRDTSLKDSRPA